MVTSRLHQKRKLEASPGKGNRSKSTPVIKEVQHYGVDYAIDSSDLRFLAGKEGQRLELGVEVVTFAGDGRLLNSLSGIGQAFFNTNAIEKAVAVATEQGSNYYSLSYSPTNKNYNGKFRKIKVTTAGKEYHLHYRRGYYATDDSSPLVTGDASSGIGSAAMQHGSPLTAQVHFAVRVVPVGLV